MYNIEALIPFECIVDIDMGLIKLLKYDYRNLEYFFPGILDGPDECIEYGLLMRKHRNPLVVPTNMQKVDMETIDNWYMQFMEKEYEQIVNLSICTDVANMIKLSSYNKDKIIKSTILCNNNFERDTILKRSIGQTRVIVANRQDFDITQYDAVYMKDVYDIQSFKGVFGKSIYIANYGFNLIDNTETDDIILDFEPLMNYIDDNELRIYSVYNINPAHFKY